jgi:hypothetical protein
MTPGGVRTHTSTYTTLFDTETVDRLLGTAHRELESDYLRRQEYVSQKDRIAIEARLQTLRATWILLLDRSTE